MIKQFVLKYVPSFLLEWAKTLKKNQRKKQLCKLEKNNSGVTKQKLIADFKKIGIKSGDSVLTHSSLSKIGFVIGGPQTIVEALFEVVGENGTLLFPSFPAKGRNKTYLEEHLFFDIVNTPSQMGSITEYFRKLPNVYRSFHPTDTVCAKGPLAEYYTNSHFGQLTPYNEFSPFRKLCEKKGKILMLGTTLNGACTNFHTLEDAVEFKYPVYDEKIFEVKMIDETGKEHWMKTKVHNPIYSAKRDGDSIKPLFEKENVLVNGMIGEAKSMLIDADKMLNVMIENYYEKGITMYTPFGYIKENYAQRENPFPNITNHYPHIYFLNVGGYTINTIAYRINRNEYWIGLRYLTEYRLEVKDIKYIRKYNNYKGDFLNEKEKKHVFNEILSFMNQFNYKKPTIVINTEDKNKMLWLSVCENNKDKIEKIEYVSPPLLRKI